MKEVIQKYNQLIYQFNKQMLQQEKYDLPKHNLQYGLINQTIIYEKAYFDSISSELEEYIYIIY